MQRKTRRALFLTAALLAAAGAVAQAQPSDPMTEATGDPLGDLLLESERTAPKPVDNAPVVYRQTVSHPLSAADAAMMRQGLEQAKRGDMTGARNTISMMSDSVARKVVTWALVDANSTSLGFYELDAARTALQGWPRAARRQAAAERTLETAGKTPQQVIAWFGSTEPQTAQGAIALAAAYRGLGRTDSARTLIRDWWRTKTFEADVQRSMLARFGDLLTQDDHIRRADVLQYGNVGPATRDMIAMLPMDLQQAAAVRAAYRADQASANDQAAALPGALGNSPGVAFERAAYLRRKNLDTLAVAQLDYFPKDIATSEQAERIWSERRRLILSTLRNRDDKAAYAAADSGLHTGADAADAEFFAGWIALTRLNEPGKALKHFQALEKIGSSPITKARAWYWMGRAAEGKGENRKAEDYYGRAAEHYTTFYGQLAGEKLGRRLTIERDPAITQADRARFEGREPVQAARLLYDNGQRDLFRVFAFSLDDTLDSRTDLALLIDMARGYGEQDTSMKVARAAAQRGYILADRAYPMMNPPQVMNQPEQALVLGITRQESGFDPLVRSHVGARGMMQLMPSTATIVARKMGVSYSVGMLDDPDYNMRLGSTFLGQLVSQFSGSYVMAIAGYNAGPGRPVQWSSFCGDPRGGASDPIDFIECIPFSETRNYVMRVMENVQMYRAKANGGSIPLTMSADLRRGAYSYQTVAQTGGEAARP